MVHCPWESQEWLETAFPDYHVSSVLMWDIDEAMGFQAPPNLEGFFASTELGASCFRATGLPVAAVFCLAPWRWIRCINPLVLLSNITGDSRPRVPIQKRGEVATHVVLQASGVPAKTEYTFLDE